MAAPWFFLLALLLATCAWVGWRLASHRAILPCPAEFRWLVEIENPLARATRSAAILARLNPRPGQTILDLGCGPGRVTLPLATALRPTGTVLAVDVQTAMLDHVQAKVAAHGLPNVRLLPLDPHTLQLDVAAVDAVVMVMMLGEVPDPHRLLTFVHDWLQPQGRLLIAESIFDPHYLRRTRLHTLTTAAGFTPLSLEGNVFGYNLLLQKA